MAHPRKADPDHPLIVRLRKKCLGMRATYEKEAWGERTFRVEKGSMFAMTDCNHHGSGHVAVWIKAARPVQTQWVRRDEQRYFVPPYMGTKGWIGAKLNSRTRWKELSRLLEDAHYQSSPPKLRKVLKALDR